MSEYIGNRIVPRHDGVWDRAKTYEPLIIVYEEGTGDSYISRKDVPTGTGLNQKEYWALCARFSEQVKLLRNELAAEVAGMEERTSAVEALTNGNKAALEERMTSIETRQNANLAASTDAKADYAAELVDARVDDTNHTFGSAGDNVRALGKTRSLLDVARAWKWTDNRIVNEKGVLSIINTWSVLHMVPVMGNRIIINGKLSYMSGKDEYSNIECFDQDRKYLGGCLRDDGTGKYYDYEKVTLPEGTAFISVNTTTTSKNKISVYLMPDLRYGDLLNNWATTWQWANGAVSITFSTAEEMVSVEFLKDTFLCRRVDGADYRQTKATPDDSVEVSFAPSGWWAVYFGDEGTDENGSATGSVHVEKCTDWQYLFTREHFVFAVFYGNHAVYVAPACEGMTINGVDYGNPSQVAATALSYSRYLGQELYLEYGGITLDTKAGTIQITERTLASCNTSQYFWLEPNAEPTLLIESDELTAGHMLVLGYDRSSGTLNLYNTKTFQSLGVYGYYIAAWYQGRLLYPHMNPSLSFTLDGTTYQAGELFESEVRNTYIEKRYQNKFNTLDEKIERFAGSSMYLASGAFSIMQDAAAAAAGTEGANTVQVAGKILGVTENKEYQWLEPQDTPVEAACKTLTTTGGTSFIMRILAADIRDGSLNLYNTSQFRALGVYGYYVASWYQNRFYNAHMNPDVKVTVNGTEYSAGELFDTEKAAYIAKPYRDYVASYVEGQEDAKDGDSLGDIVTPSHWDCMEGRQFSMFFDCLSRHEGRENLYRVTNSKSLTRNEYCLNYTPTESDTDFNVNVIRLDADTMQEREKKAVQVRVHHPLKSKAVKNICICGDSLVDCNQVATEVYRLLAEDGDCEVNQIGTRGPANGRHEGRGSWRWKDYLADTDYAGKTNAFWDKEKGRLDFQKYCAANGYDGIDYFLIALGTNDVSQGSTLYRTEEQVEKFIGYAKQFVDALLSEEAGYPDCKIGIGLCGPGADYSYLATSSMGIFRKSINTLNLALIKAFDEGVYHRNVTCFAHGLRTNRRLAFPYSEKPVTDRFTETSRTLTNSIHPSTRGYQAWADGYYCQIRAWLEEDSQ